MEKKLFLETRSFGEMQRYSLSVGTYITTEGRMKKGWAYQQLAESPCPELGPYELPGYGAIPAQVVKVEVTGRTIQYLPSGQCVRIRVTFPNGEGGETVVPGWAQVKSMTQEWFPLPEPKPALGRKPGSPLFE